MLESIYYTSKVMADTETRYPCIEKLVLALITSARRIRPYFQAYSVTKLAKFHLHQVFHKLETSCKLMKWVVELSEYDITFEPKQQLKAKL